MWPHSSELLIIRFGWAEDSMAGIKHPSVSAEPAWTDSIIEVLLDCVGICAVDLRKI